MSLLKIMATDPDGRDFSEKEADVLFHLDLTVEGGSLLVFLTDDHGETIAKASVSCKDIFANAVTRKLGADK